MGLRSPASSRNPSLKVSLPMPKPTDPKTVLKTEFEADSIVVRDFGRHPDPVVATHPGHDQVEFIAPNGRLYSVRLEGNALRVSSREGGIYVRPKADNVVEVFNVTHFEREVEVGLNG
jgi:hypothetical protein